MIRWSPADLGVYCQTPFVGGRNHCAPIARPDWSALPHAMVTRRSAARKPQAAPAADLAMESGSYGGADGGSRINRRSPPDGDGVSGPGGAPLRVSRDQTVRPCLMSQVGVAPPGAVLRTRRRESAAAVKQGQRPAGARAGTYVTDWPGSAWPVSLLRS